MVKKIAVYGTFETTEHVKQRYWKVRKDGIKQRYWKKTTRTKKVVKKGRYEFHGSGKDLYKAVVKAKKIVPKGYIDIPAKDFLKNPRRYGEKGTWIESDIDS